MYVLKKTIRIKKKNNAEYIQFCKIAIKFIIKKNILVIQIFCGMECRCSSKIPINQNTLPRNKFVPFSG